MSWKLSCRPICTRQDCTTAAIHAKFANSPPTGLIALSVMGMLLFISKQDAPLRYPAVSPAPASYPNFLK